MTFYQLDWKVNQRALRLKLAVLGKEPDLRVPWLMGRRFEKQILEPIRFNLSPRGGPDMPDVFLTGIPLFSERLLQTMQAAGADNFDVYKVEIASSAGGTAHKNYRAVNIIGKIEAADRDASTFDPRSEQHLMEFDSLVIDEKKVKGANVFRLGENPLKIIISERIKSVLDAVPLVGVQLVALDGRQEED